VESYVLKWLLSAIVKEMKDTVVICGSYGTRELRRQVPVKLTGVPLGKVSKTLQKLYMSLTSMKFPKKIWDPSKK
jgi:hypothetical protein